MTFAQEKIILNMKCVLCHTFKNISPIDIFTLYGSTVKCRQNKFCEKLLLRDGRENTCVYRLLKC